MWFFTINFNQGYLQLGFQDICTTGLPFSKIDFDQTQEHNNKRVKSTAGYIDLVNNEDKKYLRKLEDCLPEMHDYLSNIKAEKKAKTQRND